MYAREAGKRQKNLKKRKVLDYSNFVGNILQEVKSPDVLRMAQCSKNGHYVGKKGTKLSYL